MIQRERAALYGVLTEREGMVDNERPEKTKQKTTLAQPHEFQLGMDISVSAAH